jgi:hypothetical protein
MKSQRRTSIFLGVLLILVGALILAAQIIPGFSDLINISFSWPVIIIAVGLLLFVFGLFAGEPGMSVPAAIVTGIGCIFYWQDATGSWSSWSYIWSLIPGFVGIGLVLAGLLGDNTRQSIREGINLILISLILFAIFGSIFGGFQILGQYWPALLVLLGLWMLIQALFRARKST